MAINTKKYIENQLYIRTKDSNMVLLKLNEPQQMLYDVISKQAMEKKPIRVIILKARQQGMSTITAGIIFKNTATKFNVSSAVVAHDSESTNKIFNMYKTFYDNLDELLKPEIKYSNAIEMVFGKLNSGVRCMTAGNKNIGRGSTINNLHISEFAFWQGNKEETLSGLLQAVPGEPNSMIIIESTARGYDSFKELWDKAVSGESDFYPLFIPWYKLDSYRMKASGIELTQEEEKIKEKFKLDNEQIAWRRWCISNNCNNDINKFHQEYPSTPDEAFISTGESYFDKELIVSRLNELVNVKPIKSGFFTYKKVINSDGTKELLNITWNNSKDGFIRIYEEPIERHLYVVGGDTAGEGSDKYTAQVIDNYNCKQVAVLEKERIDDDEYAEQIVCLSKMYNTALLGIEVNFNGYIVRNIELMDYKKQYVRESYDSMGTEYQKKYGFKTTSITRPQILSELKSIVRDNICCINDIATLQEMLVFIVTDTGRAEAMTGKHDDLIMALAIAYGIRYQQETIIPIDKKEDKSHWMFEDEEENKSEEWGNY